MLVPRNNGFQGSSGGGFTFRIPAQEGYNSIITYRYLATYLIQIKENLRRGFRLGLISREIAPCPVAKAPHHSLLSSRSPRPPPSRPRTSTNSIIRADRHRPPPRRRACRLAGWPVWGKAAC